MIPNLQTMLPRDVITLQNSGYEFFLTGSRFFNGSAVTPSTDWDFYALFSEELCEYLRSLGFHQDSGNYGNDHSITAVFTCRYEFMRPENRRTTKIDVQLVHGPWLPVKHEAQQLLAETHAYGLPEDKTTARLLWVNTMKIVSKYKNLQLPG